MKNKVRMVAILLALFFFGFLNATVNNDGIWAIVAKAVNTLDYTSVEGNEQPGVRTAGQVYHDITVMLEHGVAIRTYDLFYNNINDLSKVSCYNGGNIANYNATSTLAKDRLCAMARAYQDYVIGHKITDKSLFPKIYIGVSNGNLKSFLTADNKTADNAKIKCYLSKLNDNFRFADIKGVFIGNEPLLSLIDHHALGGLPNIYAYDLIVKGFSNILKSNSDILANLKHTMLLTSTYLASANIVSKTQENLSKGFLFQCDNPSAEGINYACSNVILNNNIPIIASKILNNTATLKEQRYYQNIENFVKALKVMLDYNNGIGQKNSVLLNLFPEYLGLCDLGGNLDHCYVPGSKDKSLVAILNTIMLSFIKSQGAFAELDTYFFNSPVFSKGGSNVGIAEIGTAHYCTPDGGECSSHPTWFTPTAFMNFYTALAQWHAGHQKKVCDGKGYPGIIAAYTFDDTLYKQVPGDSTQKYMGIESDD
ncbi:hypothetical protein [Facilibium subflavum]|uniref:hypothetical protein n=1 Tax=Facilibium subflavum TaxID=2219058 RepID=UPI000E64A996|nr:hypothetical protein [Facilibium subflavum]